MLLKYVTVIFFCIAGEATCTIVHIQITQMNTAVTTTVIYASDSTANVFILTTPLLMLYIILVIVLTTSAPALDMTFFMQ